MFGKWGAHCNDVTTRLSLYWGSKNDTEWLNRSLAWSVGSGGAVRRSSRAFGSDRVFMTFSMNFEVRSKNFVKEFE